MVWPKKRPNWTCNNGQRKEQGRGSNITEGRPNQIIHRLQLESQDEKSEQSQEKEKREGQYPKSKDIDIQSVKCLLGVRKKEERKQSSRGKVPHEKSVLRPTYRRKKKDACKGKLIALENLR